MCGIAGIYKTGRISAEDVAAVLRMNDAQTHRGPDDWGLLLPEDALTDQSIRDILAPHPPEHIRTYVSNSTVQVILGSRRLSIIDLSAAGRMPMASDDRKIFITYNGEIYNYRELRDELKQKGCRFFTESDTEVILKGYEVWGEEVVTHLRGMFGFAVLDLKQPLPLLLLARDRFGIKQVYYSQSGERLSFASEFVALMKSGLVRRETSPRALVGFLQLGSLAVPHTFNKHVTALPAGNLLHCAGENVQTKCYWDMRDYVATDDSNHQSSAHPEDLGRSLRSLLEQTVQQHLISDVPVGVFLSGGVDSSSLVALASKQQMAPLTTISIVFEETQFSEQRFARIIAERCQTDHREITVGRREFFDEIPQMLSAMDQPTVDGVNTYVVSKAARESGIKVVLSGAGGDELFLGYDFLSRIKYLDKIRRGLHIVPAALRSVIASAAVRMGKLMSRKSMEKLSYLSDPNATNIYLLFRGLFDPAQIQQLLGMSEVDFKAADTTSELLQWPEEESLLEGMVYLDFKHYLGNQLLKDMDSMSMAHSLETRVPFLDHVLVEKLLKVPVQTRLGNGIPKHLLINAMRDDLPRAIWNRPKMGFTFPFADWMMQDSMELENRCLSLQTLDGKAIRNIWRQFREGHLHWSRPWALLVLSYWLDNMN